MSQNNIQMVVTDLDDTLLSSEKTISQAAKEVIKSLKDRNIKFTFITGRPPYAVERFREQVLVSAPIIASNGAMFVDNGEIIIKKGTEILLEPLRKLLTAAKAEGLTVLILTADAEYALAETEWTDSRKIAGRPYPITELEKLIAEAKAVYKINIMAGGKEEIFRQFLPQIRILAVDYTISVYGSTGCEIVAKGVNKRAALEELSQSMKIEMKNIMAIGDNENDVEMLKAAGIGVAVANASAAAKGAANYICENAYTDGVIEAIKKFIR